MSSPVDFYISEEGYVRVNVSYTNVAYAGSVGNLAKISVLIDSAQIVLGDVEPVVVTHVGISLNRAERRSGKSTSGYVYRGSATVSYSSGEIRIFDVQSGGRMASSSPWNKPGSKFPQIYSKLTGSHDSSKYPDTTCPPVSNVKLDLNPSFDLSAYGIPTPGRGRSAILIHSKKYEGSQGCVSSDVDWAKFVKEITTAKELKAEVTCSVVYFDEQPDYKRVPKN